MSYKTLENADIKDKNVLLRLDLDVPLAQPPTTNRQLPAIADSTRLEQTLPTLEYLLNQAAKVTVIGHLGRPKAANSKFQIPNSKWQTGSQYSLRPVWEWYCSKLPKSPKNPKFPNFLMLENLRFDPGEEGNNPEFAQKLVKESQAEIYVFDAFAVAHREHASVVQIPRFLSTFAGLHFAKELVQLNKVLQNPQKPVVFVIGGAKSETKIPLIEKIAQKADLILLGGKIPIESQISNLKPACRRGRSQIYSSKLKFADLRNDGLDITPESAEEFRQIIMQAGTVAWNGPMGKFEEPGYENGTKIIAQAINETKAFTVIGGGDTEAALTKFNLKQGIDWISSGGGAMLYYLAYGTLPFLEAIK